MHDVRTHVQGNAAVAVTRARGDACGMRSTQVHLRRFAADDLDWYLAAVNDPAVIGPHNWSRHRTADDVREEVEEDPTGRSGGRVVALPDGTAIGHAGWRCQRWGPSERSWCPAIGLWVGPPHRGYGYGTQAQRLLVDHLFATTTVARVEADTAVDNPAEQRALEKAGFTREGIVRSCEWRDGRWHDHLLYSVLRTDWPAAR